MATQTQQQTKKIDLSWLHLVIMFLLMFCFGFISPIGAITSLGMKMVGIFFGLLYGWSTMGMLLPSLMGMVALGFSGLGSVKEIVIMGFGNETIVFLIFILALVQMLIDSGAVNAVSSFIITRKALRGRPWIFSFVFLCVSGLLCTFGQAYASIFLCWGILYGVFDKVDYKPYEKYPTMMIIGVIISAAAFGIMIPFRAMPLVILSTFASITGITVNYLQYMLVMVPSGLVIMAGYLLGCKFFWRPNVSKMQEFDVEKLVTENKQVTKYQKSILIAFGVMLIVLLIPGSLPKSWGIVTFLNSIGNAGLMIICTILFSMIKVEGKPLLDFSAAARTGINWHVLLMLVVVMLMSSLLISDATGIKVFLVDVLKPILSGCSGVLFLVVLFMITLILTNFMNNIVVGVMFLPVLAAFYQTVDANPIVGVILILIAINTAFLTPAASPATAMLYAKTEWMHPKDVLKVMVITVVIFTLIALTLTMGLGLLVF